MGRVSLSDEEKKRRGTFDPRYSEENRTAAAAEKIITGVFLPRIPEPDLPLNDVGRMKYFELTEIMLQAKTLTTVMKEYAQQYAALYQSMHSRMGDGKTVPAAMTRQIDVLLSKMRVAENAKPIDPTAPKKRFDKIGTLAPRSSPIRLR